MLHNEKQRRVYIETTIPSFYYTLRTDTESLARQSWTQKWWKVYEDQFILVSSTAVIEELQKGTGEKTQDRIALVESLEILTVPAEVNQIAEIYMDRLIMPQGLFGDAHHVALASFYDIGVLLTWKFKHIANVDKTYRIRQINRELGLPMPELVTPLNYFGVDD